VAHIREGRYLQGFGWDRPRYKWEGNIKMDLREMGINGANWIQPAQDRVQWQAFVNTLMNLQVP